MSEATTGVPGREALGQHHAERLAAERRGGEDVGGGEHLVLALVARRGRGSSRRSRSTSSGATSGSEAPTIVSSTGTCSRSASKARSRIGQALALDGLADEGDRAAARRARAGAAQGRRRRAARRRWARPGTRRRRSAGRSRRPPRRRRSARSRWLSRRRAPKPAAIACGGAALGVAVERADHRLSGGDQRVPADQRRDRLVHVDDVEVAPRAARCAAVRRRARSR